MRWPRGLPVGNVVEDVENEDAEAGGRASEEGHEQEVEQEVHWHSDLCPPQWGRSGQIRVRGVAAL